MARTTASSPVGNGRWDWASRAYLLDQCAQACDVPGEDLEHRGALGGRRQPHGGSVLQGCGEWGAEGGSGNGRAVGLVAGACLKEGMKVGSTEREDLQACMLQPVIRESLADHAAAWLIPCAAMSGMPSPGRLVQTPAGCCSCELLTDPTHTWRRISLFGPLSLGFHLSRCRSLSLPRLPVRLLGCCGRNGAIRERHTQGILTSYSTQLEHW